MSRRTPRALQPELITAAQADQILEQSERAAGLFTAELVEQRRPEDYARAMALLVDGGLSQRQIAEAVRMSRNTIARIYKRMGDQGLIEPLKRQLATGLLTLARVTQERALEMVMDDRAEIPFQQLMIGGAVATDKHVALMGAQIDAAQASEELTERDLAELANVIEITDDAPAINCGAEDAGAKGARQASGPALMDDSGNAPASSPVAPDSDR